MTQLLYTTREAAERLGIGKTKLFELLRTGEIPATQIGAARLIAADDLADFVSRLRADAASPSNVAELLSLIDDNGYVAVNRLPSHCTLADIEAVKRVVAERLSTVA